MNVLIGMALIWAFWKLSKLEKQDRERQRRVTNAHLVECVKLKLEIWELNHPSN